MDTENNPVIRPQYTWAGDFREGRAEVETPSGMGLIDRQGRYVIPPEYEIVDYAPAESIVPGAERRPLGGIRLPGTTPDGIWNE